MRLFIADSASMRLKRCKNTTWFWRGVFVAVVAHSWMAVGDLKQEALPVWSESVEVVELADVPLTEPRPELLEFDLEDNTPQTVEKAPPEKVTEKPTLALAEPVEQPLPLSVEALEPAESDDALLLASVAPSSEATVPEEKHLRQADEPMALSDISVEFPSDVPMSEVERVSRTFQGLIQENLRSGPYVLSERFAGSLNGDPYDGGSLAKLETEPIDESEAELGFVVGQDVDEAVEKEGLDPFKTYVVVNGRIRAVSPSLIARPPEVASAQSGALERPELQSASNSQLPGESGHDQTGVKVRGSKRATNSEVAGLGDQKAITLSKEEVEKGLSEVTPQAGLASLDGSPASAQYVTVSGVVRVPEGFAPNKVVLRLAVTGFQVQTDAAGHFELRDVPKGTRFELLVWHLDGGLTRRLVPVAASSRESGIEIELVSTTHVDALAKSFGLAQQMNLGGFCARVDIENPTALVGASVYANTIRKNLATHYFSDKGLPSVGQTELTPDGRFCIFNIEESLVDVKLVTLNGTRRQFTVHVEPSTFEHDLILDASHSFYLKVSLLEPLDTREVIELSGRGVQPEFGDKRLRNWIFGEDTPVWTRVANYVLMSDEAYAPVKPNPGDVQFFPGGQKFIEVKVAPDMPDAPWGRVLLSRDDLMTDAMLKRARETMSRVHQDTQTPVSFAVLDADAWDEIISDNHDVPAIGSTGFGGLYLSIDASAMGRNTDELNVSVRDTWTGESVCEIHRINSSSSVKSSRFFRAACGAKNGQFALIVQSEDGALLWSDVVRIRQGTVQTVTVMDPNF